MEVIERPDLIGPDYARNHHRVAKQEVIENAISTWTSKHSAEQVLDAMRTKGIPVGRVVSVKDIVEGEQVNARGAIRDVWVDGNGTSEGSGWNVKMNGTFPVLEGCDPQPRWAGPDLGRHTEEIMLKELGMSEAELTKLRMDGVVG